MLCCRFSQVCVADQGPALPVCWALGWGLPWVRCIKHPLVCWGSPPDGNTHTKVSLFLWSNFNSRRHISFLICKQMTEVYKHTYTNSGINQTRLCSGSAVAAIVVMIKGRKKKGNRLHHCYYCATITILPTTTVRLPPPPTCRTILSVGILLRLPVEPAAAAAPCADVHRHSNLLPLASTLQNTASNN